MPALSDGRSRGTLSDRSRLIILLAVTLLTVGIHYGWLLKPFGNAHWLHAIHGRLCYVPIVMAAAWFGLRGGLLQATAISLLVLPYVLGSTQGDHNLAAEWVEIFFYFAIAVLVGLLVEREYVARRREQEAQLQLERSQKLSLAGQIAASVAHEIKNPLASIKGAADILTDPDSRPADRAEFGALLQTEIRRINGTVQEFLEFARPREARLEAMNLSEAVRVPLRQLESEARERDVRFESQIEPDLYILGDAEKIHQLSLNLLLNAIQASPAGRVIHLSLSGLSRGSVQLEVGDEGAGVAPEHLDRLFEPFFTTRTSGTGLGLPIAKGIVERHGGTIAVRSRAGHGTRVTVELPRLTKGGGT
jgi:signal transduction histidine kinase